MQTMIESATFEIAGGLVVSDPCYIDSERVKESGWGVYHESNASGRWNAEIEISDEGAWGDRVASITAKRWKAGTTVRTETAILGVDAGLMSIVPDVATPLDYDDLLFELGKNNHEDKMIEFAGGVICSTGYGDGGYEATMEYDSWGLSKITVVFIDEEQEEEDENYCIFCMDDISGSEFDACEECRENREED